MWVQRGGLVTTRLMGSKVLYVGTEGWTSELISRRAVYVGYRKVENASLGW